jgi:hypothetical protein
MSKNAHLMLLVGEFTITLQACTDQAILLVCLLCSLYWCTGHT